MSGDRRRTVCVASEQPAPEPDDERFYRELAEALVERALSGDLEAIVTVLDIAYGPPEEAEEG